LEIFLKYNTMSFLYNNIDSGASNKKGSEFWVQRFCMNGNLIPFSLETLISAFGVVARITEPLNFLTLPVGS
jgi:hypothetical protein